MLRFPKDMSKARVLIVNDDGINAKGIKVLEEIMLKITPNVWVVAPQNQQSAAGHSFTLHEPLRLRKIDDRHFAVKGTPTDSTLVGVQEVLRDARPDIVLSGINHGENSADDVTYSGTISAAMEAVMMKIPAIAFSQTLDDNEIDWSIAEEYLPKVLKGFEGKEIESRVVISVNIPVKKEGVTPEIKVLPHGHFLIKDASLVERKDPSGKQYFWIGDPPARDKEDEAFDVGALHKGHVTVTPLGLNLTHYPTLEKLEGVFDE